VGIEKYLSLYRLNNFFTPTSQEKLPQSLPCGIISGEPDKSAKLDGKLIRNLNFEFPFDFPEKISCFPAVKVVGFGRDFSTV